MHYFVSFFSTPIALISFMVLIETVRNIIRPLTLSVRLIANIVAGHLLLLLLSKFTILSLSNLVLSSVVILILGVLEIGVSVIQAYVFVLLSILYAKEAF
ncbi:ATP synthase subunit a [Erysiphe neolycopersici]|uniref:ATP synthase subunit a n=1 Tax=Erysiphe neolycopersici TaxID=212602 RepID=A0A420H7P1_9PEZI|nr:ATP synthase subunit a [Erysiphe neolycopersici]